ncbi:MAG: hypothetical protein R3C59_07105 [Planctomycetaceae bacterium]
MPLPSRRQFLQSAATAAAAVSAASVAFPVVKADESSAAIDIGSRRELFVDRALIEKLSGGATQQLQHPVPREVSLVHDAPWEGTGCGYHSVFQDGDRFRMYYKSWHLDFSTGKLNTGTHPLYCCYAESSDGVTWRKPMLGLHDFQGSKQNNITMTSGPVGSLNVDAGHPAIFKDDNPNAAEDARYKAIFRSSKPNGLLPFKSPDGLTWSPMTKAPILHGLGAFDSQNLAFWDPNIGKYRAYWRIFTAGVTDDRNWKPAGIRAIRTATSDDMINWDPHTDLTYEDSPPEELYTNQIKPYHRAPHLLLGFPARYIDRGWSESMKALPALEQREMRAASSPRYGTAITDALFMASRNGTKFKRWNEAFLRPGIERPDAWHYGHQYIGWHIVETRGDLPGAPNELSLYASESYWHGKGSAVRRYTLRLDGFVAVNGPAGQGGELLSKLITFDGSTLHLNLSTSAAGRVAVELQNPDGSPVPGYGLADCHEIFGDSTDRTVSWKDGTDVSSLAGKPVRLRFQLQDADLYAFQFVKA